MRRLNQAMVPLGAAPEHPNSVEPNSGRLVQVIEFIDERERKQGPNKSRERTLVRSTAKKNDHLKRRLLNANHVPPTHPRTLKMTSQLLATEARAEDDAKELVWISPQTLVGQGRIDPFNSFPVKMSPYMHHLIDYCKEF